MQHEKYNNNGLLSLELEQVHCVAHRYMPCSCVCVDHREYLCVLSYLVIRVLFFLPLISKQRLEAERRVVLVWAQSGTPGIGAIVNHREQFCIVSGHTAAQSGFCGSQSLAWVVIEYLLNRVAYMSTHVRM